MGYFLESPDNLKMKRPINMFLQERKVQLMLSLHLNEGLNAHFELFCIRFRVVGFNLHERQTQLILHKIFQRPGFHSVSLTALPCQIDYGVYREIGGQFLDGLVTFGVGRHDRTGNVQMRQGRP